MCLLLSSRIPQLAALSQLRQIIITNSASGIRLPAQLFASFRPDNYDVAWSFPLSSPISSILLREPMKTEFRHLKQPLMAVLSFILALACQQAHVCAQEYRSISGLGNNIANPTFGEADTPLIRLTPNAYADGISTPRGGLTTSSLPSARAVSNAVSAQNSSQLNSAGASDWLWQWGQFLDHDLDLSGGAAIAEPFDISVPTGDSSFDPTFSGTATIGLNRTISTGGSAGAPREQINEITSFIDASNVYGSDAARAVGLRDLSTNGLLRTSSGGNMLPFNTTGLSNDNGPGLVPSDAFVAGDIRANEQIGLTATHTLFMREHNRVATDLAARIANGEMALISKRDAAIAATNDVASEADFIYQSARQLVGAQIQKITYDEFLPVLLGSSSPTSSAASYDPTIDASVSNEFSTAAFRVGHTMLSSDLQLVDPTTGVNVGSVPLQNAFFTPSFFNSYSVDNVLAGLASQAAQEVDTLVIDDVRNFLFGPPGAGGLDLASLNIQRGRDHAIGDINAVRAVLGLVAYNDFNELTGGDLSLAADFASVYNTIDDVDLWAGGLAEAHVNGGMVGETYNAILADQFTRSRDGDRFFFESNIDDLLCIDSDFESTLLSDIILRNSDINTIQSDMFLASSTVPEPSTATVILAMCGAMLLRRKRTA